jgi:hypothetical protein
MPATLRGRIVQNTSGSCQIRISQCPGDTQQDPPPTFLLAYNDGTGSDPFCAAATIIFNAGYRAGDCVQVTGSLCNIGSMQAFCLTNFRNCGPNPC